MKTESGQWFINRGEGIPGSPGCCPLLFPDHWASSPSSHRAARGGPAPQDQAEDTGCSSVPPGWAGAWPEQPVCHSELGGPRPGPTGQRLDVVLTSRPPEVLAGRGSGPWCLPDTPREAPSQVPSQVAGGGGRLVFVLPFLGFSWFPDASVSPSIKWGFATLPSSQRRFMPETQACGESAQSSGLPAHSSLRSLSRTSGCFSRLLCFLLVTVGAFVTDK